jgi:hypothetical protein
MALDNSISSVSSKLVLLKTEKLPKCKMRKYNDGCWILLLLLLLPPLLVLLLFLLPVIELL